MTIMQQTAAGAQRAESPIRALPRAVRRGLDKIVAHFRMARAEAQLRAMNDHQLRDIGLDRADIHRAVCGLIRQDASRRPR